MKRAKCPHIGTVERVYREHPQAPELNVAAPDGVEVGERVTLADDAGNECVGTVRRLEAVVVPDFDTFRNPRLATTQGRLA